ncbi:MAG: hypothetical protein ABEJ26_04075 [Halosimplex sp.]
MSESPIDSRPLRYAVLLAVWIAFAVLLWVVLGAVSESQPAHDVGTFLAIVGVLVVWAELHARLTTGRSRWDPRAWRE